MSTNGTAVFVETPAAGTRLGTASRFSASPRVGWRAWDFAAWLGSGALLILVPKCLVCLAGYFALGAAGLEFCGPVSSSPLWTLPVLLGLVVLAWVSRDHWRWLGGRLLSLALWGFRRRRLEGQAPTVSEGTSPDRCRSFGSVSGTRAPVRCISQSTEP